MGNSHPGANETLSPPITSSVVQHHYHTSSAPVMVNPSLSVGESRGIPVPNGRSDRFEEELSSSLSGISGLSAHNASRNNYGSLEADIISPGQYMTRLRANSVSVEHASRGLPVVVKWDGGGINVSISGTFNRWEKKIPLVKSEHNFYTIIELEEGEHQYKYFVDGQWRVAKDEPIVTDSHGHQNNVIVVKKSDFEIVAALEDDGLCVEKKSESTEYPEPDYGQEIPSRKMIDKHVGPPVLPQHLLQVLLNKDVAQHLEPTLLPEPNHVMLNHLYALSIKDSVMVLSDTSRFKKKCVTTLLYKPID